MTMSRGRREGSEGAGRIKDSSLPGISPASETNMNAHHTFTPRRAQTIAGLAEVKALAIPQEQAARRIHNTEQAG